MSEQTTDVVVVGAGVAGLSAAVAAAESTGERSVLLLDKAPQRAAGGNTRWTDAYFRLEDVYEPADGFAEDMARFSQGKTDAAYVKVLLDELPDAMDWIQGHGVRFHRKATYFVTASKPRMMPVGGGEALIRSLTAACEKLGVQVRYDTDVHGLRRSDDGWTLRVDDGEHSTIQARACIVASGGFEGDPDRLARHLGEPARAIKPIAPGGAFNTGELLDALIDQGVAASGEWSNLHGEPVDTRSSQAEASVMVFPYGILVDKDGRRFIDEGLGTVDETYEDVARAILVQPDVWAGFVTDSKFYDVPGIERGLLTDQRPYEAATIAELAGLLQVDADALQATVASFNAAGRVGSFDPLRPDGLHTENLTPAKSNWATRLDVPPYYAIPLTTDIVFTYGGVATNENAELVDGDGVLIPGLYAAGECTGIYYHKYPGATSVMRGLVFGRLAGRRAVAYAAGVDD